MAQAYPEGLHVGGLLGFPSPPQTSSPFATFASRKEVFVGRAAADAEVFWPGDCASGCSSGNAESPSKKLRVQSECGCSVLDFAWLGCRFETGDTADFKSSLLVMEFFGGGKIVAARKWAVELC